jgi:transposase
VVVPQYVLARHRRQKYRCRCNACVVTAPGSPKLLPGGRYSPEFAAHVAERKYLDHLPLARQQREMERRGLEVDRQTLWDQLAAAAGHLRPSYEALGAFVMESELVYADETSWSLLGAKDASPRWWVWCVAREEAVVYRILPQRSQVAAARMLGSYAGYVMTDGYAAYPALQRAGPGFELVHCWAHVRRKFLECQEAYPEQSGEALRRIAALFRIEQAVPRPGPGADEAELRQLWELRLRLRREQSRSEIDALREWAYATKPRVLPQSGIGQAIDYLLSLWPGLTKFLTEPRVPLTNNHAERALRGPVVGRKNHYGSRSKKGTEVAALFYSLFESAKLAGVDPYLYVLTALRRAIQAPGTATLPRDLRQAPEA